MCRTCILSKDFATLGQRPYVYSKGFIPGRIMLHLGWDYQLSQQKCVVRGDSISLSPMRVFHHSVGCNFRWLPHNPHILLALIGSHDYLNSLQTHWSGILEDVSFDTHLPMGHQHDSPHHITFMKCFNGCLKVIPDVDWSRMWSSGFLSFMPYDLNTLATTISVIDRNCGLELNNL